MEPILFGQVLLNFNLVTKEQLDQCVSLQENNGDTRPLGEILIERGLIDERTLATILSVQERRGGRGQSKNADFGDRIGKGTAHDYLRVAREMGASDLYMCSGERPTVRLHGNLVELPVATMEFEACRDLIFSLLTKQQIDSYYERKQIDAPICLEEIGRFRANIYRHWGGIGAVFRLIPDRVHRFGELGLPDQMKRFVEFPNGLVLVTGATGSGKSTTLASLIDLINQSQRRHVLTLEDPIETVFHSNEALITQREIGSHADSFDQALRSALREDADVLVVGEMRDPETMKTALLAAETGHLVFGTMHTRNAFNTIVRIIDQFPGSQRSHVRSLLASTLRGVVCQELIPNTDGNGRSVAAEIMLVNSAIANLIREDRVWQIPMVMQTAGNRGMQLMDDALERLVQARKIPLAEALSRASSRDRFVTTN